MRDEGKFLIEILGTYGTFAIYVTKIICDEILLLL